MRKYINVIRLIAAITALFALCLTCGCQNNGEVVYIEDTQPIENDVAVENISQSITPTIVTPSPSPAVTERPKIIRDDADFRNAKWGDSIENVLEYEYDTTLIRDGNELVGDCVVADENVKVYYVLENNKLIKGGYYFDLDTRNGQIYISTYDKLKSMLIDIYGDPIEDKVVYRYGESSSDFFDDVLSLEAGYTTYAAQWETNTTEILLGMYSKNYEIFLVLIYEDISYEEPKDYSGL